MTWLDNLGRAKRHNKNEKLENFLTELQRLTVVHETDHTGSYYRFAQGPDEPGRYHGAEANQAKGKNSDDKTKGKEPEKKAEKQPKTEEKVSDAAEGDKRMEQDHGVERSGEEKEQKPQPMTEVSTKKDGGVSNEKVQAQGSNYLEPTIHGTTDTAKDAGNEGQRYRYG